MTHWKKNLDNRYISGEDLMSGLKGLQKETPVKLIKFQDGDTFDQKKQSSETRTILYFAKLDGTVLSKGVVLNKTNAKFFVKEMGSAEMEDWNKKPVLMFAKPDSRHGFVVRFKRYEKPTLNKDTQEWTAISAYMKGKDGDIKKVLAKYTVSDVLVKELTKSKVENK